VSGAAGSAGLTYLFTDVEGSTELIQELGSVYGLALRTQRHILTSCVEANDGQVIRGSEGDGSFFVFTRPTHALNAAVEAQRKLMRSEFGDVAMRVRMGLHTGPAVLYGGEHVGLNVHIAARVCSAAYGGQILCSGATAGGVEEPADGIRLKHLGEFVLRGISEAHAIVQVCADDLPSEFGSPRGAVRAGGSQVTIWRLAAAAPAPCGDPQKLEARARDGGPLPLDVHVEIGPAAGDGAFRLSVLVGGAVREEFDGLTVGGACDAATVVNAYSALISISS
jgi:class 3 adenylate cyclase